MKITGNQKLKQKLVNKESCIYLKTSSLSKLFADRKVETYAPCWFLSRIVGLTQNLLGLLDFLCLRRRLFMIKIKTASMMNAAKIRFIHQLYFLYAQGVFHRVLSLLLLLDIQFNRFPYGNFYVHVNERAHKISYVKFYISFLMYFST